MKYENVLKKMVECAERKDYRGWDPYDGLNSIIFRNSILYSKRIFRLLIIQFFKRCPFNLRPFFLVPKQRNPKGIALFASGFLSLYKLTGNSVYLSEAKKLLKWLKQNYSKGYSGFAWGYNFPWQSRNDYKKAYLPTIVTTSFVAMSFLDGYEVARNKEYMDIALSSAEFMLKDLNIYEKDGNVAFSYGPKDFERVYNATALGAQFFGRLFFFTKDKKFYEYAKKTINFVAQGQNMDGSWFYGKNKNQKWIDNFHTGFNLIALKRYEEYTQDMSFHNNLIRGYEFYKKTLFTKEGLPKYYDNSLYPVDIHTCAVSILVFLEFGEIKKASEILDWTIENMWNRKGYFNYQITRFYKNTIPYMRWSQAWMFYAMTAYLSKEQSRGRRL